MNIRNHINRQTDHIAVGLDHLLLFTPDPVLETLGITPDRVQEYIEMGYTFWPSCDNVDSDGKCAENGEE